MIMTEDEKYCEMIKILARNCDVIDSYLREKWKAFYTDLLDGTNEYTIYAEMVYTTLVTDYDMKQIVRDMDDYDRVLFIMYLKCDKVYK